MTNKIYCGDSKFVLEHDLFDRQVKVDLIYLDPPFFTEKIQKGKVWSPEAMEVSYNDSKQFWADKKDAVWTKAPQWLKDIAVKQPAFASYLFYMMERLEWCHHVLKDTGSIYLHCDYRASHYLKMIMDKIFDRENFQSEIIWTTTPKHDRKLKHLGRFHDTIFYYTKTSKFTLNMQYQPLEEKYIKTIYKYTDSYGCYKRSDLSAASGGQTLIYEWKGHYPPKGRYWMFSKDRMEIMDKEGKIDYGKNNKPYLKTYLKENRGIPLQDVWIDISPTSQKEKLGYPTQKPLKLLERIIKVSSNEGDLVLDTFCGCGTAIVAAQKLGRQWIGIDINPDACKIMQKRFKEHGVDVNICWRDTTVIEQLNPSDFEEWVNDFFNAKKPNPDRGVDGITSNGIPIQTKTFHVGYNIISQFLNDAKYHPQVPKPIKTGIVVSQKGFEPSARQRTHEIESNEGIEIRLVTPKELIPKQ